MTRPAERGQGPAFTLEGLVLALGAALVVASEFVVVGLAPALAGDLDMSLAATGWLVAAFAAGSAIGGPLAVIAARRLRADHALSLALLPFAAGLLTPLADTPESLAALRLVQGATLPLFISVGSDVLARLWKDDVRAVGRIYLGVAIGSVLAAAFGATAADLWGWRAALAALGALSGLALLLVLVAPGLRRSQKGGDWRGDLSVLARPRVLVALAVSIVQFAAMFCAYAYLGGLLERVGVVPSAVGFWLLVFGAAGLAGNHLAERVASDDPVRAQTATLWALLATAAALPFLHPSALTLAPLLFVWGAAHAAGFLLRQLDVSRAAVGTPRLAAALNISAANVGIAAGAALGGGVLKVAGVVGVAIAFGLLSLATLGLERIARDRFASAR